MSASRLPDSDHEELPRELLDLKGKIDQLDGEIATGAWLVLDAEPADVFGPASSDLWRGVLRRQPGRLAWLANAPDDLSMN